MQNGREKLKASVVKPSCVLSGNLDFLYLIFNVWGGFI